MSENNAVAIGSVVIDLKLALLIVLVIIAAAFDIKYRRIPNWLVLIGLVAGLGFGTLSSHGAGISGWSLGFAVGFGLFLPLYLMRAMGAGDVKLIAMVGGFLGAAGVFEVILLTLLAGGGLAAAYALLRGSFRKLMDNVNHMVTSVAVDVAMREMPQATAPRQSAGDLPYGVAIATGTLVHVLLLANGYRLLASFQ